MLIRNTGNRQFRFDHNVAGVSVGTVYANSEFIIKSIGGACMTGFEADWTANFN
jgi:hypothetical protein